MMTPTGYKLRWGSVISEHLLIFVYGDMIGIVTVSPAEISLRLWNVR